MVPKRKDTEMKVHSLVKPKLRKIDCAFRFI